MTHDAQVKNDDTPDKASGGVSLMRAREAAGFSRADMAARLHLTVSYIEYIEEEQFQHLPTATFTTGYIRNYAKCLGVSDAEMLERYEAYVANLATPEKSFMRVDKQAKPSDPVVKWATISIVVAILAFSTLWWRMQQDESGVMPTQVAEEIPANLVDDEIEVGGESTESELDYLDENGYQESEGMTLPENEQVTVDETNNLERLPDKPVSPAVHRLEAAFKSDSWIEVKDASGRILYTGTKKAGATLQLESQDIFDLVIGNPSSLALSYNGAPVDLSDYISSRTIAKFKLQ